MGSFGIKRDGLKVESVSCPDGCNGWNITYGIYIGRISFVGATSTSSHSIGNGLSLGEGSTVQSVLAPNDRLIGFQVYYNLSGIHAMRMEFADFPPKGPCYDNKGDLNGQCLTESDWLAILWGFLTLMGVAVIAGWIVGYMRKRRHKQMFRDLDAILPLH